MSDADLIQYAGIALTWVAIWLHIRINNRRWEIQKAIEQHRAEMSAAMLGVELPPEREDGMQTGPRPLRCRLGFHDLPGVVGECQRSACDYVKRHHTDGHTWTRHVAPPDEQSAPPPGMPARRP